MKDEPSRRDFLRQTLKIGTGAAVVAAVSALGSTPAEGKESAKVSLEELQRKAERIEKSMKNFKYLADQSLQKDVAPRTFPALKKEVLEVKNLVTAEVNRAVMNDGEMQQLEKIYQRVDAIEKEMDAFLNGNSSNVRQTMLQ